MVISSGSGSLVLVCAADDNYAMPLAVTVRSVLENLRNTCKVALFIIDGGISQLNKRKIIKSLGSKRVDIDIKWVQIDGSILEEMKISGHITIAAYYRLLIPQIVPKQFKKAIYLDSDLIVNRDLEQLWKLEIGENYLLAAQDTGAPYVSSSKGLRNYRELGIPPDFKYFNSGVLVINLEKWRTDSITLKVIEYLEQNKEQVRWWDQDGLNAVLAGKWGEIDPRWNQTPFIYEYSSWKDSPFEEQVYKDVIDKPYIIHFANKMKPWNLYYKHPYKNLFFRYADKTAWAGLRWLFLWVRLNNRLKSIVAKKN